MAVRTIKLRIVLDNAQALRSAKQFGAELTRAGRSGKSAGTMVAGAWTGLKSMFTTLAGAAGIGLVVQQFRKVIQNIYETDRALATFMRNQQERQSRAAGKIASAAGTRKLQNVFPGTVRQISDWQHRFAAKYALAGGPNEAANAAYALGSASGDAVKKGTLSTQEQMNMFGDVATAASAWKVDAGNLSEFGAMAWQSFGLRDRKSLQGAYQSVIGGAKNTPFEIGDLVSAMRRSGPAMGKSGMSIRDSTAFIAGVSPFFAGQPRFAGRFADMLLTKQFRKLPKAVHDLIVKGGGDVKDQKPGFQLRRLRAMDRALKGLSGEERNRTFTALAQAADGGVKEAQRMLQAYQKVLEGTKDGGLSEYMDLAFSGMDERSWGQTKEMQSEWLGSYEGQTVSADITKAHGQLDMPLEVATTDESNWMMGRLESRTQGRGWQAQVTNRSAEIAKKNKWKIPIRGEVLSRILAVHEVATGVYTALRRTRDYIGKMAGSSDTSANVVTDVYEYTKGETSHRVDTKKLWRIVSGCTHHMQMLSEAKGEAFSKAFLTSIERTPEQAAAKYRVVTLAAMTFLRQIQTGHNLALPTRQIRDSGDQGGQWTPEGLSGDISGLTGTIEELQAQTQIHIRTPHISGVRKSGPISFPSPDRRDPIPIPDDTPASPEPVPTEGDSRININTYYAGPVRNLAQAPGLFNPDIAV